MYLTGPYQHYISSDVGLAFWKYFYLTQDKTWLANRGYPMLKEVADFWVSRAEQKKDGSFVINNVVSADEYAVNVDNDVFTNAAAKSALLAATKAAQILAIDPDLSWQKLATDLFIGSFDNGITREHDTY